MSGSGANLPISIRLTGTAETEAAFNRVSNTAGTAMQRVEQSTQRAANSAGMVGQAAQAAGFQVQDFANQIAGGQSALLAFSQQASQFLGIFGAGGALAGGALAVGVLTAQIVGLADKSATLADVTKDISEGYDRLNEAADRRLRGMRDEAEAVVRLASEYTAMGLAASRAESLLVERRGAALDLEAGRMREALQGTLSSSVTARMFPQDGSRGSEFGVGDLGLARAEQEYATLADALARVQSEAGRTMQNMRDVAAEADRLAQAGGSSATSFVRLRDAALDLLPAAAQLDGAQRQLAVQTLAAAEAAGANDAAMQRYAARFGELGQGIMSAAQALNSLRQQVVDNPLAGLSREISQNQAVLSAIQRGGQAAGERVQRSQQDQERITERATRAQQDFIKSLEATGVSADEARRRGEELGPAFVRSATDAVATGRAVEDGLKRQAAAAREASQEFGELRRNASGLLTLNTADVRGLEEAQRQIRGTQADPAVRARQAAELARAEEREADRRQAEADRFSERWGDRIALETTRGLFEGARNGESAAQRFGNALRNILVSSVSSVISRNLFQPLISAGFSGGGIGGLNFGGLFGGGAPVAADGGSLTGAVNQLGRFGALNSAGQYGNLGAAFGGTGFAGTGFTGLDSFLNYQLIAPSGVGGTLPAGVQGPLAPASGGLTAAGAIGGAAGIAGGAYGIYSGLQRGGIGGYTTAAGGLLSAGMGAAALAGLGSLGPPGWIAAAGLAIAGALLPGARPSGRGQTTFEQVDTGATGSVGLTGSRFSQGNLDRSRSATGQIADLAREIGGALGGAQFGGGVSTGVTNNRLYLEVAGRRADFANSEDGAKQLAETAARFVLQQFREENRASGDYAAILNASGDSIEKLTADLEFYNGAYQKLGEVAAKTSEWTQALQALVAPFDQAITKAQELQLSTDRLNEARGREVAKLEDQFRQRLAGLDANLDARNFRLNGNNRAAEELLFDLAAKEEVRQAREAFEQLGLPDANIAWRITYLEEIQGRERLEIAKRYGDAITQAQISSGQDVLNWLNGQALGSLSSLSPTARLSEAERQFNAAVQSGAGVTSAADALLSSSRDVLGGASAAFAEREAFVRSTVGQVGLRNARATGNADVVNALAQMVEILSARLGGLQSSFDALSAETRRANNLALVA